MLSRIVIPIDGSTTAERIFDYVAPIARRTHSQVVLVTVFGMGHTVMMPGLIDDTIEHLEREANAGLDRAAAELHRRGVDVTTQTRFGSPAMAILETVESERASLVAMTTHGRTGLSRWLMGSVAESVVRHSPVPVLVLRATDDVALADSPAPRIEPSVPRRILVPLDGSEAAGHISPFVIAIAKLCGAKVDLLHVARPALARNPAAEGHLRYAAQEFVEHGIDVETHVRHSEHVAPAIRSCAEQLRCDIVAMPTHGYAGLSRLVMGSVTESVLRACPIPILVVRHGKHDLREWRPSARELAPSGRYQIGADA